MSQCPSNNYDGYHFWTVDGLNIVVCDDCGAEAVIIETAGPEID